MQQVGRLCDGEKRVDLAGDDGAMIRGELIGAERTRCRALPRGPRLPLAPERLRAPTRVSTRRRRRSQGPRCQPGEVGNAVRAQQRAESEGFIPRRQIMTARYSGGATDREPGTSVKLREVRACSPGAPSLVRA